MWAQLVAMAAGLWAMAAPGVIGYDDPARSIHHVIGPIVASLACVALWEIARGLRWANLLLGAALLAAPLVQPFETAAALNSFAVGATVGIASLIRGQVAGRYGGGWRALWQ